MLILRNEKGEILLEKRPPVGIWGGLWSLPETAPEDDVARHCRVRFGADVVEGEALPPIEHGFTHYRLTIVPQRIGVRSWPPRAEAPGLAWLTRGAACGAALPAPIKRLLRAL
jgi:A/G-specific adenine glycosylase